MPKLRQHQCRNWRPAVTEANLVYYVSWLRTDRRDKLEALPRIGQPNTCPLPQQLLLKLQHVAEPWKVSRREVRHTKKRLRSSNIKKKQAENEMSIQIVMQKKKPMKSSAIASLKLIEVKHHMR
jgi:hypothetical protein